MAPSIVHARASAHRTLLARLARPLLLRLATEAGAAAMGATGGTREGPTAERIHSVVRELFSTDSPEAADHALLDALLAVTEHLKPANVRRSRRQHSRPASAESEGAASALIAAQIGASRWEDVRITLVDGHTVRVGCGKKAVRRTYRDLGLFARSTREPTRKWEMLVAVCEGHGTFDWRMFGAFGAASQTMSVLRGALQDAFGLLDDPFHEWHGQWRARFLASSELGER